jgi:putative transposase
MHLVVRGNDRQDIFKSDGDRIFFHRCLVDLSKRHHVAVHAYVFMSNHVHLLATGSEANSFAKLIQGMGRRYVSYFNYLHGRTGTLWEGRFHSSLVQEERYFLACHRYIEMNPVRAGMVPLPAHHAWSSFGFNRLGRPDDLITPHSLYLSMGRTDAGRYNAYARLFDQGMADDEKIRDALRRCAPLGDRAFCKEIEEISGRRVLPRTRGRPRKNRD